MAKCKICGFFAVWINDECLWCYYTEGNFLANKANCKHWCVPEEWTTNDKGQKVYPCQKCGKEFEQY